MIEASVVYHSDAGGRWFSISTPYKELSLDAVEAYRVAYKILTHLDAAPPVASTPPAPALILAQRIASIAAETGLKPRLVLAIINEMKWDEETKVEKAAARAAAPQENQPDATDPAMVYAARIKAVMDLLGCDVNTARSVVINAEYFTKKAADNA
jgi:hypothetical protein